MKETSPLDLRRFSQQFDLPYLEKVVPLPFSSQPGSIYERVPLDFFKEHGLVPVGEEADAVSVALSDPAQLDLLDTLAPLLKKQVRGVLAPPGAIREALLRLEQGPSSAEVIAGLSAGEFDAAEKREGSSDLVDFSLSGPVVKLVNRLLLDALERRATDIHIQPEEKSVRVRLRVDGVLHDWGAPPPAALATIVSRIKVMSGLNIAEKRLPQDGRTTFRPGDRDVDLRVSVVPTAFGERVVLRLLDKANLDLELGELGFSQETQKRFESLIGISHGIVLVTGPTGSGKTTTLYAALNRIQKESRNILTIEDPIEYRLEGISQMQVKPEIGLTFAKGLRSLLRQDPDVLMVGEIRDAETAQVAVQAALTGHLVLATLHTNDAPGALTRLMEIGVEPYLVNSTVRGALAQRLVRLRCRTCGGKNEGCRDCFETGYSGRIGIYELLIPDGKIQKLVAEKADGAALMAAAQKSGMKTLLEDGLEKVSRGLTTREEVLRVTITA